MRRCALFVGMGLLLGNGASVEAQQPSGFTAALNTATELSYLTQSSVRDELKLSPEQVAKIGELRTFLSSRSSPDGATDRTNRTVDLEKRAAEVRPQLQALLNAEQRTRFRQIVRQQQRKSGLGALVRSDEIREPLKITDGQLSQIQAIQSNLTNQRRGLDRGTATTKTQELIAAADREVEKLLTAEQNAQVRELLGPAFTGEIRTGFSGFPTAAPGGLGPGGFGLGRGGPSTSTQLRTLPFRMGTLSGPSLGLLNNAQTQRELKLSDEQTRQVAALPTITRDDPAPSLDFLLPDQLVRLNQLTLQYANQRYGPLGALHYAATVESLRLTREQDQAIAAIAEVDRKAVSALGSQAGAESLRGINRDTAAKLEAALTDEQRARLKEQLGAPFAGQLSTGSSSRGSSAFGDRGRRGFSVGTYSRSAWSYLSQADVQADLKLTDEQRQKLSSLQQAGGVQADEAHKLLTADQIARLSQIQLQYSQQRSGAVYIFRYRDVVEAMNLTDDQKQRIQSIGNAGSTGRGTAGEGDDPSQRQIDEILTEDQKGRLKQLLGEPFRGEIRLRFGSAAPRSGAANSPPATPQ